MGTAVDLLEQAMADDEAHEHLRRGCPWFRHVGEGGPDADHIDRHCRPDGSGHALVKFAADGCEWVVLTPRTAEASTVPQPTVPPGGPGLFHVKGLQLPPYVQHLYKHLVGRYGKHGAYRVAVGVVKKWAQGVHPGGRARGGRQGRVHGDVQAAAQRNVAEWESDIEKAHEHSGEHRAAATAALAGRQPAPDFPGRAQTPLPPVPGTRDARTMYTAHRLDDVLRHVAHAEERLGEARRSKALRAYHMMHVNNHLSSALDTSHHLVESVRKNYPAEGRELDALNKTIGLAVSLSPEAKVATFAHLMQTLLNHLGHAKRHAEVMRNPDPAPLWKFNDDHAGKHLAQAKEHAAKLAQHVLDNYPDEARWLRRLDEQEDPAQTAAATAVLLAAGPVLDKAEVHYRPQDSPEQCCGNCSMAAGWHPPDFESGTCTEVKGMIEDDHVCDDWARGPEARLAAGGQVPGAWSYVTPQQRLGLQYGLYQHPAATTSPSPPLPPQVKIPTPAEVRTLSALVPDGGDIGLSRTVRKFIEAAAVKLEHNTSLEALAALRATQAAVYAAHKKDQSDDAPFAWTAPAPALAPPAAQSSVTSAMKISQAKAMAWRRLDIAVAGMADRIRKNFFRGVYSGPSTEARMSAVDRLAQLAARDVSFPVEPDVSQELKLYEAFDPDGFTLSPAAAKDLAAMSPLDRMKVTGMLSEARDHLHHGRRQLGSAKLLAVKFIAATAAATALESELADWIRSLAMQMNNTQQRQSVPPGNLPPQAPDKAGSARLSAVDRLVARA